ncbi:hypothetical protein RJ641_014705 [Dillenia turbinata]|uniref:COBRA C-terminal domain-containing protein n=1 Tax=Dillenia turbinata TaxID=194707 RepID=A0AAN8V4X6_9MAGN
MGEIFPKFIRIQWMGSALARYPLPISLNSEMGLCLYIPFHGVLLLSGSFSLFSFMLTSSAPSWLLRYLYAYVLESDSLDSGNLGQMVLASHTLLLLEESNEVYILDKYVVHILIVLDAELYHLCQGPANAYSETNVCSAIGEQEAAYEAFDPNGNIVIKWDIISWSPDGYVGALWHQLSVGLSGTSKRSITASHLALGFFLFVGHLWHTGRARAAAAGLIWSVVCTYLQFVAAKKPSCCVSFSSFYCSTIVRCLSCACGCQNNTSCVMSDSHITSLVGTDILTSDNAPQQQCTEHVPYPHALACKGQLHIVLESEDYHHQLQQWNELHTVDTDDTGMFFGIKYNDILSEAAQNGNVQAEIILQKDMDSFTSTKVGLSLGEYILMVMNA